MAVWALTKTSSLDSVNPNLNLRAVVVETQPFHFPTNAAVQKKGFNPYWVSRSVNRWRNSTRAIFATNSGHLFSGRLWATLSSQMQRRTRCTAVRSPNTLHSIPRLIGAFFTASLVTQGVVARSGANLLYPAIAVNAQQRGGIVFTLVGPNDYPSAACPGQ